jgi:hypothetical protein
VTKEESLEIVTQACLLGCIICGCLLSCTEYTCEKVGSWSELQKILNESWLTSTLFDWTTREY